jgi:hypothetical protein
MAPLSNKRIATDEWCFLCGPCRDVKRWIVSKELVSGVESDGWWLSGLGSQWVGWWVVELLWAVAVRSWDLWQGTVRKSRGKKSPPLEAITRFVVYSMMLSVSQTLHHLFLANKTLKPSTCSAVKATVFLCDLKSTLHVSTFKMSSSSCVLQIHNHWFVSHGLISAFINTVFVLC